jgi:hypothetical protein
MLLLGAAFAAMSAGRPPTTAPGGMPRLHVDRDLVDLGDVTYSRMVDVAFTLTNTGDGVLRFETPYIEVVEGC